MTALRGPTPASLEAAVLHYHTRIAQLSAVANLNPPVVNQRVYLDAIDLIRRARLGEHIDRPFTPSGGPQS